MSPLVLTCALCSAFAPTHFATATDSLEAISLGALVETSSDNWDGHSKESWLRNQPQESEFQASERQNHWNIRFVMAGLTAVSLAAPILIGASRDLDLGRLYTDLAASTVGVLLGAGLGLLVYGLNPNTSLTTIGLVVVVATALLGQGAIAYAEQQNNHDIEPGAHFVGTGAMLVADVSWFALALLSNPGESNAALITTLVCAPLLVAGLGLDGWALFAPNQVFRPVGGY
jgi:hypothetical protein